jgi:tetratricopeptide (TPR) repeat protein
MLEQALAVVKENLLENLANGDALILLAKVLLEVGRGETARKVEALADQVRAAESAGKSALDDKNIVKTLFAAAYALSDIRQFDLSAKMLNESVRLAPDEPVVQYELAFALMCLNRFSDALAHFEAAAVELNDFDTNLNLAVCHTLMRNLKAAHERLDRLPALASTEEERKELAHRKMVLKRLESLGNRSELTARDWLYVLYGSVLLRTQPSPSTDSINEVAESMLFLRGVLEGLRMEIEIVEYYNPSSKPLARILSELMDIPFDSYKGPDRPEKTLLMMAWATDMIGPHRALIDISDHRTMFAYGLPRHEPLPLIPEIVCSLTNDFPVPWSEQKGSGYVNEVIEKILQRARHVETDPNVLRVTQECVDFYHLKREWLLLGNDEAFPERPEYTAEIPAG